MAAFDAGQIVLVDWRDALPREPNKLRPAVVVENDALFVADYPNVILVLLSSGGSAAPLDLALAIEPTAENGCISRCYALSCYVTTASLRRVQPTPSRISPERLQTIRRQIALAIGIDQA